jgi:predicted alpha/beta-hydrolase family hydrolase
LVTGELRVEWKPGRFVGVEKAGPDRAPITFVLAHGAGAGRHHEFMSGMQQRLAAAGMRVVTFDYPYVAEGRRAPDRLDDLVAAHRAVVATVVETGALLLGGKSMGGRVSSYLAEVHAEGFVFLGYPLVPIGKTEARETGHLRALRSPLLFVQGERDRLAPLDLLRPVIEDLDSASLEVVADADHSYRVPKRAGVSPADILDRIAAVVVAWVARTIRT